MKLYPRGWTQEKIDAYEAKPEAVLKEKIARVADKASVRGPVDYAEVVQACVREGIPAGKAVIEAVVAEIDADWRVEAVAMTPKPVVIDEKPPTEPVVEDLGEEGPIG